MREITNFCSILTAAVAMLGISVQGEMKTAKEPGKSGKSMEDEQWLSTISQYSRKIKHWNRFRDDDYIRSWDAAQVSSENVDTTKDPCQKMKCSQHKVCVAQGYQRAVCVNRKKLEHRIRLPLVKAERRCSPCPVSTSGPVCGTDGHNYASQCKLEQQACLSGKELSVKCSGLCPCPSTPSPPPQDKDTSRHESCTGQDLADLGDRLRDWFQLLQGSAKQNSTGSSNPSASSGSSAVDRSLVASCKDSVGWMFSKLDTNGDLFLDQAELAAINLDKYELCIRPFFNSCDSYRDGQVSMAEWCLCFWRDKPPCLEELQRIQMQEGAKRKPGAFVPSCDEDGYYRKLQCDESSGECWCVDQHGAELTGSRLQGNLDCDEVVAYSGDFGSGVGWEDEEEKQEAENMEEAEEEEEEEEVGEVDDGGYIW
ncbi:testican-2 [Engraulis encrasicolus]|uniref:testican-2 n=1 Tax=Engraulis encrasicolus TaxID=184585 RepID=UPI002FD224EC